MEALVGLAIFVFIVWILFIRGVLWRLALAAFAFVGMRSWLLDSHPNSHHIVMTVLDYQITWATMIPAVLILLVMATTNTGD